MSLIIATITFARDPYTEPGKPGTPEIVFVASDRCVLKYTAPDSDGGSPIIGYFIELKNKYVQIWEKVNENPINALDCVVSGMKEGNTVEFRVRAQNKAGKGEPSDASRSVTFKRNPFDQF